MRNWFPGAMSAGVIFAVGIFFGQARAAGPEFEVANITPAAQPTPELFRSGKIHIGMTIDGARVDIGGMPLTTLIQQAFRVKQFQVVAPDWAGESRWDILAKLPDGGSQEQVPEMLLALLTDRFKLAVHRENKELPVYALVVGKVGLKMQAYVPEPGAVADAPAGGPTVIGGFGFLPPPGGPPPGGGRGGPGPGRGPGDGPGGGPGGGSMSFTSAQYGTIKISGSPQEGRIHLEASKVSMVGFAEYAHGHDGPAGIGYDRTIGRLPGGARRFPGRADWRHGEGARPHVRTRRTGWIRRTRWAGWPRRRIFPGADGGRVGPLRQRGFGVGGEAGAQAGGAQVAG